jgi:hypothetical protein
MNWDEVVYRVTLLAVILGLVWLVLAPMPSGEPLVQLVHQAYIA